VRHGTPRVRSLVERKSSAMPLPVVADGPGPPDRRSNWNALVGETLLRWSEFQSPTSVVPVIALLGAVLVSFMGTFGALYEDQLYKQQKVQEIVVQARILAAGVTTALELNDAKTAQQYVNALKANPDLEFAAVFDRQGRSIAKYAADAKAEIRPNLLSRDPVLTGNHIGIAVPVAENGVTLGKVYLRGSMDSLRRRLLKYGVIVLVAAMAALLLAVLASAQSALSKANLKLKDQARDLFEANANLQYEMRERAKIEEALRQSQKMEAVGQLSGGIAHDFNNFLTIIKGNLHLLNRRISQGQTDVQRYVDSAIEGVDRAVTVTQRVLAFSRRQPLSPEPNNLSHLISDALPLIRQSVGGQIEVRTRLDADWLVYCDTNQMENVLINLAINARDAMPAGGELTFSTGNIRLEEGAEADVMPGEYVELLVRDTGIGMSEEVRQKALDPFFTTKPHGKGTGLGLSMSFGFVRQSAGYLSIESAPGAGTIVRILLPRRYAEQISKRA
jgi:signal transduction histidine kinase